MQEPNLQCQQHTPTVTPRLKVLLYKTYLTLFLTLSLTPTINPNRTVYCLIVRVDGFQWRI